MKNCLSDFNGERIDLINGYYHPGNGYRAYSPVLMRLSSVDSLSPFGVGGINPYTFCDGDPVNHADPTGHLSWQAWQGIGMGIVGLGLAVFTAGTSIASAGGIIAAMESASAVSLTVGAGGVISDVTAIASGAAEERHPRASVILGWVSLGAGVTGLAHKIFGTGKSAGQAVFSRYSGVISWGGNQRNILPLAFAKGNSVRAAMNSVSHVFEDTYRGVCRLNIVAHGSFSQTRGFVRVRIFDSLESANDMDNAIPVERLTGRDFARVLRELDIDFTRYRYARTLICNSGAGGANSFAATFSAESGLPTKGFLGLVSTRSQLQRLADLTIKNNFPDQACALTVSQINSRLTRMAERGSELFSVMKSEHGYSYDPIKFGYPD